MSERHWIAPTDDDVLASVDGAVAADYLADESAVVPTLCERARLDAQTTEGILSDARGLVAAMRAEGAAGGGALDAFMGEYDLSTREGLVLMCLAEALLRIPDDETADRLIADKLGEADFHEHLGTSESLLVNVSTWALMLTGRIVKEDVPGGVGRLFAQMLARLGEPVIRSAMRTAMRIMSEQFVMGRTIEAALARAAGHENRAYRYSFDMLGEAALTSAAADGYFAAYSDAIAAIGRTFKNGSAAARTDAAHPTDGLMARPGISVKLSALGPRFEHAQTARVRREIVPRLTALTEEARDAGIGLTIDAEEADRLELTLDIFARVYTAHLGSRWHGLGIAVQAYQKRALAVVEWLARLAADAGRTIPVRLVKGAYWDTEIKAAQVRGLTGYPVFTRKDTTDVSYLACARALLESPHLYPQFATHNAHTAAWIIEVAGDRDYEFQRLHGMGEELYAAIVGVRGKPCRVYAPVGAHEDLLPYLVRRLLENGANSSFVNRFVHAEWPIEELVRDPVADTEALAPDFAHPRIPLPRDLYGSARQNSAGPNLADAVELRELAAALDAAAARPLAARAIPAADAAAAQVALATAHGAFEAWNATPAAERAAALRTAADALERARAELVVLVVSEGRRTIPDAVAEVREAVDFLRYYAREAERLFGAATTLPGPTGESNELRLTGRGVFVCLSPWNFPVAIFTGQVAAALAAGNTVIAKPAEQTPIVAARVVELMHSAGVPAAALGLLPGDGPTLGRALLPDPRVAGVAFTGSTETAKRIERMLAAREGPIAALIAETGGVNAMIADSSALTEQVVKDAVASAFNSAGQRCSALRLLCLQEDTADAVIAMLIGRMRELVIGDPALFATDVGPVIDADALAMLGDYVTTQSDRVLYQCKLDARHSGGGFFPPTLIELDAPGDLDREIFGPVLHVVRYEAGAVDAVVDALNTVGYGLTLGVQSRIGAFARRIASRARVGNIYVNRDMIGAVVGVQPFGGLGLSGTGPKAGGPHYLARFGVEKTLTINTAAVGGNTELLELDADR